MTLREWLTDAASRNEVVCNTRECQSSTLTAGDVLAMLSPDTLDRPVTVERLTDLYATEGKVGHLAHIGDARWWLIKRDRPVDVSEGGRTDGTI